jgi:hypothetical protein
VYNLHQIPYPHSYKEKNMTLPLPVMGDKISSPEFAFGIKYHTYFRNVDIQIIAVDGVTTNYVVGESYNDQEIIAYVLQHGELPKGNKQVDMGAYDESRGKAIFVVEQVIFEGESRGYIDYKDPGLIVYARKLHPSGLYNPDGELIMFHYHTSSYGSTIKNLTIDGHMQIMFV